MSMVEQGEERARPSRPTNTEHPGGFGSVLVVPPVKRGGQGVVPFSCLTAECGAVVSPVHDEAFVELIGDLGELPRDRDSQASRAQDQPRNFVNSGDLDPSDRCSPPEYTCHARPQACGSEPSRTSAREKSGA